MSRRKALEDSGGEGDSPLQRWSQRKLESRQMPLPVREDPKSPVEPAESAPLTDADMPDLDTLSAESDYSSFLSPGVSEELRRLALRQLFRSPHFNVRDGLDDYDDDFTSFAKLGGTITSDLRHRWEMQRQRAAAEKDQQNEAPPAPETSGVQVQSEHPDETMSGDREAEDNPGEADPPISS